MEALTRDEFTAAAGGGAPRWNCHCVQCGLLPERGEQRLQECAAVSGDGRSWCLLNASPDIRTQLLGAPELAPGPHIRQTPVRGVIGLRLAGPRTIVYAPCFATWTPRLDEAIDGADIAVIDGTFRTPEEMPGVRGHLPMTESLPRQHQSRPVRPQGLPLAGEMELL
jgi:hypothetical protein